MLESIVCICMCNFAPCLCSFRLLNEYILEHCTFCTYINTKYTLSLIGVYQLKYAAIIIGVPVKYD
jgi:hypothetical protein